MTDTFSILSRELTRAERKLMLARILSSPLPGGQEEEPAAAEAPAMEPPSPEEAFAALGPLRKLLLLLMRMFTGRSLAELTKELLLRSLQRAVVSQAPGLVEFPAGRLTPRWRAEVESLRTPQSFFRGVLTGMTERREFVAFLSGIELDPLNERIAQDTDPRGISEEPFAAEDRSVRAEMIERLERIIDEVPRERRARVQQDVERLRGLEAFSLVRLDDAVLLASDSAQGVAPRDKGERLRPLLDALWAARGSPEPAAWHALFLFRASAKLSDPSFDTEKEASLFSVRAAAAHAAIRGFLRRVPLLDIVRCLSEDLTVSPKRLEGGESWLAQFRRFWEERLEGVYREYVRERRLRDCVSQVLSLCGLAALPALETYRTRGPQELSPVHHETSVGIFRAFHEAVFLPKMERYLKLVALNGDFYKDDNRASFMSSFEGVHAAHEACRLLDRRLSPGGDLASRLAASEEGGDAAGKLKAAWEEANKEARRAVEGARSSLSRLSTTLYGILYGEVGGQFDTLVNLGTLGGRENKLILKGLDAAIAYADRVASLLGECLELESSP